jgi:hypothetical protein
LSCWFWRNWDSMALGSLLFAYKNQPTRNPAPQISCETSESAPSCVLVRGEGATFAEEQA